MRAETEALMDDKLDEEIDIAKKLLEIETDCEQASPVRYRIADLWDVISALKAKRSAAFALNVSVLLRVGCHVYQGVYGVLIGGANWLSRGSAQGSVARTG